MPAMSYPYDEVKKAANLIELVNTGASADLKNQAILNAIGEKDTEAYDFNFSIWILKWEPEMRNDYTGNYSFGHIGAKYLQRLDLDSYPKLGVLLADNFTKQPGIASYIGSAIAAASVAGVFTAAKLREVNPDKTDVEIFAVQYNVSI